MVLVQLNIKLLETFGRDIQKVQITKQFQVLKEVLVENYEQLFLCLDDFTSQNMYSGLYDSMNNDIYYHPGLIEIDPPNYTFESSFDSLEFLYNMSIDDDKVSFWGINLYQNSSVNASFQMEIIIFGAGYWIVKINHKIYWIRLNLATQLIVSQLNCFL